MRIAKRIGKNPRPKREKLLLQFFMTYFIRFLYMYIAFLPTIVCYNLKKQKQKNTYIVF